MAFLFLCFLLLLVWTLRLQRRVAALEQQDGERSAELERLRAEVRQRPRPAPAQQPAPEPRAGTVPIPHTPAAAPPPPDLPRAAAEASARPVAPSRAASPAEPPWRVAPPRAPSSPPPPPLPRPEPAAAFDWEALVGVRLFSWVAGIALALAGIFFLGYSIQSGWLQPPVRMAIGLLVGVALLVACELHVARRYAVTANAMDAAGIVILFSTVFASYALWHLIGGPLALALLVLVTVVAVVLSIRRDSVLVALLGLVGGFSTPALLSTGQDNPIGLFGYLLLLNAGLAWVAYQKRWTALTALSLLFTTLYQWTWAVRFLTEDRLALAGGIFLVFPALAVSALAILDKDAVAAGGPRAPAPAPVFAVGFRSLTALNAALPVLFAVHMAAVPAYGVHYGILFGFLLCLDGGLFALTIWRGPRGLHVLGAVTTLIVFFIWLVVTYGTRAAAGAWPVVLGLIALFTVFYLGTALAARHGRRRLESPDTFAVYAAPLLLLAFHALALREPAFAAPALGFSVLFLLLALMAGYAVAERSAAVNFLAIALAQTALIAWTAAAGSRSGPLPAALAACAAAAVGVLGSYSARQVGGSAAEVESFDHGAGAGLVLAQLLLVVAASVQPPLGLGPLASLHGAFLIGLLALAACTGRLSFAVLAVLPVWMATWSWQAQHRGPEFWLQNIQLAGPLYLAFLAFPLVLGRRVGHRIGPYLAATLAAGVFFHVARVSLVAGGYGQVIGLLPVALGLLHAVPLAHLLRIEPAGRRALGRLALVAGTVLAFATVAVPLQLDREWVTIGWALEGAALAALYRRVPHRGLFWFVLALFAVVFVRLAVNPDVLAYEPRSSWRIVNWYLYTYLVCAASMLAAGRLLATTDDAMTATLRASQVLPAGATILLFVLLNIEIADYFSTGDRITFNFSAGLAQDLTYTLAWGVFAVALLVAGIVIRSRFARLSALALLVVTVLKGFLHDIARLGGLYRVLSFVGLAVCLSLVALMLQRFVLGRKDP